MYSDIGRQVARGIDGVIVRRECLRPEQLSFGFKQEINVLLYEDQGMVDYGLWESSKAIIMEREREVQNLREERKNREMR